MESFIGRQLWLPEEDQILHDQLSINFSLS